MTRPAYSSVGSVCIRTGVMALIVSAVLICVFLPPLVGSSAAAAVKPAAAAVAQTPVMPSSVPKTPQEHQDQTRAMAILMRYLFNTVAIGGFIVIVLIAGIRLMRGRIKTAVDYYKTERVQRKLAQSDLINEREHLLSMLEGLLDVYFLMDGEGRCHTIINNHNDPWWPTGGDDQMGVDDLFPQELVPTVRAAIRQTLRENAPQTLEFKKIRDEEEGWFESRTAPLRPQGGESERVIWIVRNITARKQAIDNVRALSTKLALVEEKQRQVISAELHDTIGQNLALNKMKLGLLGKRLSDPDSLKLVQEIVENTEACIGGIRETINDLSPPILYRFGLVAALKALAERHSLQHGIAFSVEGSEAIDKRMDRESTVLLYRVVRELMFNIIKHSGAAKATIDLAIARNWLTVTVTDNGRGFDAGENDLYAGQPLTMQTEHFGLFTIREAAISLGGECSIQSGGEGTAVTVRIPYPQQRDT